MGSMQLAAREASFFRYPGSGDPVLNHSIDVFQSCFSRGS